MFRDPYRYLRMLDLTSGKASAVTEVGGWQGKIARFDWSDDGKTVVFIGENMAPHYLYVFVSTLGVPGARQLAMADPVYGALWSVALDPQGQRVAYSKGLDDPTYTGNAGDQNQVETARDDAYVQGVASTTSTAIDQGKFYCPNWSPDGSHIVFGGDDQVATLVDADGSNAKTLNSHLGACAIAFSPDGTRLVSIGPDAQGNMFLEIADPSGQAPDVTVPAPDSVSEPSWQRLP
jgi:Tol biopolymer transport system component